MNISDFIDGTAYINLYRSRFKCDEDFEDYCRFLEIPTTANCIQISVSKGEVTYI